MDANDWRDLAQVLEAGERSARHKDPVLASALDSMARQCRRLASQAEAETPAEADPTRPPACGNCGSPGEDLDYDPGNGWSCPHCFAVSPSRSHADETGG